MIWVESGEKEKRIKMDPRPGTRQKKSEFQLILEFIGYRNLIIVGVLGSLYFSSGIYNYIGGMPLDQAFNPYFALHVHNSNKIASSVNDSISSSLDSMVGAIGDFFRAQWERFDVFFQENIAPFLKANPILSIVILVPTGFLITVSIFLMLVLLLKKIYASLPEAYTRPLSSARRSKEEEIWSFDPRRKPTDEQLRKTMKNLEKHVLLAPALSGNVPEGADLTIRDIARKNQGSEYSYRCAIYVMGPIKGLNLSNENEVPLALDQIKKLSNMMGRAAVYETIPLDMVILRSKKGKTNWQVNDTTSAINLGRSYPIKVIEQVMAKHKKYFIWDSRAKKSKTGYGLQQKPKITDEAASEEPKAVDG